MKKLLAIVLIPMFLVGCGKAVEVPPAHIGKVLTKNGYAPDSLPPSKFRLPACFAYCDKLILIQTADIPFKESMELFMPKDQLKLKVEVRGTMSVAPADSDRVLDRITPNAEGVITGGMVYNTYTKQAIRGVIRSQLVKHSIADILSQRDVIGETMHAALVGKISETNTPGRVSRFELAHVLPPPVIVNAQEKAKERAIAIEQAEADAQVKMVEAERALEVAKADRLVEREKAEAIAEQNEIAAKSITPEVLAYKRLETAVTIYTALAASNNVVIVPADSAGFQDITSDAVLAKLLGKELKK